MWGCVHVCGWVWVCMYMRCVCAYMCTCVHGVDTCVCMSGCVCEGDVHGCVCAGAYVCVCVRVCRHVCLGGTCMYVRYTCACVAEGEGDVGGAEVKRCLQEEPIAPEASSVDRGEHATLPGRSTC